MVGMTPLEPSHSVRIPLYLSVAYFSQPIRVVTWLSLKEFV
jgi:hypothetical protein